MQARKRRGPLAALVAWTLVAWACGDDTTASTSSTTSGAGGDTASSTTSTTSSTGGSEVGGGGVGGAAPDIGACEAGPTPGPLSTDNGSIYSTGTYTDWTWPTPMTSMEWLLAIEKEPPNDGYFWAHQFGFAGPNADGGYLGLQIQGAYQADPPAGPVVRSKMAVFSIAGASLAAELGDIAYPDARTYSDFDGGAGWNIHVKFDWVACRPYALRMGQNGTDGAGNLWYGAWVKDTVTKKETYLGRILVPAQWGLLNTFSIMWTERFGYGALTTCAQQEWSSVIFGAPTGDDGALVAQGTGNHFYDPPGCPNSRFTDLPAGVRQEEGVP